MWILQKVHKAAEEEVERQGEQLTAQLSELYMMLDTGKISEEEFTERETAILDRLDEIEAYKKGEMEEDEEEESGEESEEAGEAQSSGKTTSSEAVE
jgi:hypothetical protein